MKRSKFSETQIVGILKEWEAGREENYHFHDLRSYFASELIKRNTNPLIVQNLFARSDMSITTAYAQTDEKLMLEAVKRLDIADAFSTKI